MRVIVYIGSALLLAACGTDDSEQVATSAPDYAGAGNPGLSGAPGGAVSTQFAAADGGTVHGAFRVVDPEGEISIETINQDGTLAIAYADGSTETGRWQQKGAGTFCVTMDYEGATEACFQPYWSIKLKGYVCRLH